MSGAVHGGSELGWGDLERTVRAIEAHHRVTVSVVFTVLVGSATGCRLSVVAVGSPTQESPAEVGQQPVWAVEAVVGSPDTWPGCPRIYRQLIELDSLLSVERWAQKPLPA